MTDFLYRSPITDMEGNYIEEVWHGIIPLRITNGTGTDYKKGQVIDVGSRLAFKLIFADRATVMTTEERNRYDAEWILKKHREAFIGYVPRGGKNLLR